MTIDFNKIFPGDIKELVSKEELDEIKKEAYLERGRIDQKYSKHTDYYRDLLSGKAFDIAYCTARNQYKSDFDKAFLAANIVFTDERFAAIIENADTFINKDLLASYLRVLSYLKARKSNKITFTEKDQMYERKANTITNKLVKHFNAYVGNINPEIIINKISEILSFKPELISTKVDKIANKHLSSTVSKLSKISALKYVYYCVTYKDNNPIVSYNYVLNGDNIVSSLNDLMNLVAINQEIMTSFKNENINFEFRTISGDAFDKESIDMRGANLANARIIYAPSKVKIKRK